MSVAITNYQYAGRISICLRYDAAIFTVEEAQKLLMLIVERCYSAQRETPEHELGSCVDGCAVCFLDVASQFNFSLLPGAAPLACTLDQ